jgi:hypothetical protein
VVSRSGIGGDVTRVRRGDREVCQHGEGYLFGGCETAGGSRVCGSQTE